MAFGLLTLPFPTAHAAAGVKIDIAAITDFHGHIEMAPNLSEQVKALRKANPNTFFVSTGDTVGGSTYVSSIAKDEPTMKIVSALGLDVSGLGNHEFDGGYSDIVDRQLGQVSWDFVNSNISGLDRSKILPYKIRTTKEGVRVGFIGATTSDLPNLVNREGLAGLRISDPIAALDNSAATLKDGKEENGEADVVVALLHEDYTDAARLGANVDAVVAGHTHTNQTTKTASGAPVIQPDCFGRLLGDIEITVDANTKKVTSSSSKMLKVLDATKDSAAAADPTIFSMVRRATARAAELGKEKIGTITSPAKRGVQGDTGGSENRGAESTLGNLIAEGFYQYAKTQGSRPSFAIMNAGGLRAPALDTNNDGVVTVEESYNVQPFNGDMGTIDLTPAQVYQLVEQQWKGEGASRPMLKLAFSNNFVYTFDPTAKLGSKVLGIFLDGKKLARNDTASKVRVAGGTFLLKGGDGYTALREGTNFTQLPGVNDLGAFNKFLAANPNYAVDHTQKSIGITGPSTLKAGETAHFKLSSLSWTTSEPNAKTVTIEFAGKKVGAAPIDNKVVPSLDETGRAEVTFTVPRVEKTGYYSLGLRFGNNAFAYPIRVQAASTPGKAPVADSPASGAHKSPKGSNNTNAKPLEGPNTGTPALVFTGLATVLIVGGIVLVCRKLWRSSDAF
ncbi:5'-nucleotidase protein [Winkia neuii]|nr:bifunctional UDP-sugar hydrolase/5'-nucleotidase [Winkia neuii]KWZ73164.1 5'-nucleotidase protein [Winkia neuii]MDK8099040.1 bifunctional UDP-sugar hydrolase/5'-nucleotidase [Winkia neuii]